MRFNTLSKLFTRALGDFLLQHKAIIDYASKTMQMVVLEAFFLLKEKLSTFSNQIKKVLEQISIGF